MSRNKVTRKNIALIILMISIAFGGPMEQVSANTVADAPLAKIEHMSFVEAPVGYILQSLGRMYNLNFSISTAASARKVSIEFNNITFQQAVEMIGVSSGVVVKQHGNNDKFYIVQTTEEQLPTSSEEERQRAIQENALNNLITEIVTVKYVSVADVENVMKQTLGMETGALVKISATSNALNRNYGSLLVSTPNQKIMETAKRIIKTIDIPKPMVEMEVLFVELVKGNNESGGIDMNLFKAPFEFQEVTAPQLEELFVPTSPLNFGQIYRMTPWQAEATIQAIKGSSKSRVLADPKIRVMSGRQAIFSSETQIPILSRNADGEINTDWKNVGIHIDILPVVLDDGTIHIKTMPRSSSITGEKKLGDVVAPIISERKAETEVIMNPGETMIIGGLMSDREIKTLSKVPFLSDIPLIGPLFRSARTENEQSTIVIFLRPHILKDNGQYANTGDVVVGGSTKTRTETAKKLLAETSLNDRKSSETDEYLKLLRNQYGIDNPGQDTIIINVEEQPSNEKTEPKKNSSKKTENKTEESKKTNEGKSVWVPPID